MGTPAGSGFSGGGISPEQAGLAQYTFGERALGGASRFGASGMGMSTNETLAGGVAPAVGQAVEVGQISDALAAAQTEFANAQQLASKGLTSQGLTGLGKLFGKGSQSR